ncbi:hypothetical protein WME98_13440 [Sorangium sp. So ce296]|uniref:hypothetical protein n=1 Tax=Sorangium sp. So ce296 TaxID=3133296 RepID=UPI003F643064
MASTDPAIAAARSHGITRSASGGAAPPGRLHAAALVERRRSMGDLGFKRG